MDKVVASPTQTRKELPIWAWMTSPGTPDEQMVKFISEDPTREPDASAEIKKWRVFLKSLRDNPINLANMLNEDGQQKVIWWKRFFENGAGVCLASVKTR